MGDKAIHQPYGVFSERDFLTLVSNNLFLLFFLGAIKLVSVHRTAVGGQINVSPIIQHALFPSNCTKGGLNTNRTSSSHQEDRHCAETCIDMESRHEETPHYRFLKLMPLRMSYTWKGHSAVRESDAGLVDMVNIDLLRHEASANRRSRGL